MARNDDAPGGVSGQLAPTRPRCAVRYTRRRDTLAVVRIELTDAALAGQHVERHRPRTWEVGRRPAEGAGGADGGGLLLAVAQHLAQDVLVVLTERRGRPPCAPLARAEAPGDAGVGLRL